MITATPDPNPAESVRHIRLTVALLLAALLALLWWTGHGPFARAGCCGAAAAGQTAAAPAVVAPPPVVTPAPVAEPEPVPPAPVEPVAEAVATAPEPPAAPVAGQVAEAPAEAEITEVAPMAVPTEVPVESPPAEQPPYTLTDPNAQVRTEAVELAPWTGPSTERLEHFVYYPPAKPAAVEPVPVETPVATPVAADVPPRATIYFATSKWDLPADVDATLTPIIAYLKANAAAKAVIQGFHDPRGDVETNAFLAKNRAGAIWNVLTAAGIDKERVIMEKPADTTGTGSLAEARRAEVSVRKE